MDARANRTTYAFDANDQLTGRRYPDGSRVTFVFDSVGSRSKMEDVTGRYTYSYDALNRSKTVTTFAGETITYSFDAVGNRKSMLDPDGGRFTYSYDPADRIDHLVNPQNERTSYSYDAAGRRTLKKLANGTRASFSYDAADRLTTLYNLKSDSSVISSFEYGYDNAANRTHVVEANGDRVTWSYDKTYQLTAERRSGANAYSQTFVYDSVGNRLVKNADGSRTTTVYDAANQIEHSVDVSGRTTYTFDANGNQQLVVEPNGVVRRIHGTAKTSTQKLNWHPAHLRRTHGMPTAAVWARASTAAKPRWSGTRRTSCSKTDGADTTQVIYTLEPQTYGSVVSERRKDSALWVPSYYHFDAIGSTRNLTDDDETIIDTWLYDAWGNIVSHTGTSDIPFLWIGQVQYYYDVETGQCTIRVRIFGPQIARWLSKDPSRFADSLHLFQYVANSPCMCTDPSGLRWSCSPDVQCTTGLPLGLCGAAGTKCVLAALAFVPSQLGASALNPKELRDVDSALNALSFANLLGNFMSRTPNLPGAAWTIGTWNVPQVFLHTYAVALAKSCGVNLWMQIREDTCLWVPCGNPWSRANTCAYSAGKLGWHVCKAKGAPNSLAGLQPPVFELGKGKGKIEAADLTACFCDVLSTVCPGALRRYNSC